MHRIACVAMVVLVTGACASSTASVEDVAPLEPIDAAGVLELLAATSQPVVLNVWASWCTPCRSEAPLLRRAHEQFGDEVSFIGIDVRDSQDRARAFIAEFDLDGFSHRFDAPGAVPDALGGFGVPLTFFIAPGGEIVRLHSGVIDERTLAVGIDDLRDCRLMEFSLLGAAAVAATSGLAVLRFEAGRTNAAECTRQVWDALITATVVGLIVGRLVAMVAGGTNPLIRPADILIVRGGVDTVAASVAGILTYAWMVRHDLWLLADAAAPAALASLSGWHAGCLVRDSCLGARSSLPWAVGSGEAGVARHPVELYAAVILILGAVILHIWKTRQPRPGSVAAAGVAGAALARLATEPMRLTIGGGLAWWYGTAGLAFVALAIGLSRRTHPGPD